MIAKLATPLFAKLGIGMIAALLLSNLVSGLYLHGRWKGSQAAHLRTVVKLREVTATLVRQNHAIAELERVSQARARSAARALTRARQANAGTVPQVEKLKASAAKPSGACVISETLRTTEGL